MERLTLLALAALLAACGTSNKKTDDTTATGAPSASTSAAPVADAAPSPFSVALESKRPIVLAALEGGVIVADAAGARWARARGGDLEASPMPGGLPSGPGRVVRIGGRMPRSIWLVFETLKDDGKADKNPVFRLQNNEWKQLADDWKPAIVAWSKNRVIAGSTSSGHLKIKVVEPSLKAPPEDLPNARLSDASCEKSLRIADLAALRTGEVVAVGTCKPDTAAGAGASAKRYVAIRWPGGAKVEDAGAHDASDAGPSDAGASDAGDAPSAGPPGIVDVMPGVSVELVHEALTMRSASDVHLAARETPPSGAPVSHLFHFDGATWGVTPAPPGTGVVRGLADTADGTLWLATERAVYRRAAAGAWDRVPLPGTGAWEVLDVRAAGDAVWIAGRRTDANGARDVVLRLGPAKETIRWD